MLRGILCCFNLTNHTALEFFLGLSLEVLKILDNTFFEALQNDVLLLVWSQIFAVLTTKLGLGINFFNLTDRLCQRNIVIFIGLVGYGSWLILVELPVLG